MKFNGKRIPILYLSAYLISFIVKISKLPEETVREIKDKLIKEGKLKESNHG
ncbi:MAG: hypothetical protein K2N51_02585 [Lachnospiraceae bacterium]|nr:hypothetical protein [Lachnospiraceae bacterium]